MTKKNVKCKTSDGVRKTYHKTLVNKIKKVQSELQRKADKKFGKGKVFISETYASKIVGGRL